MGDYGSGKTSFAKEFISTPQSTTFGVCIFHIQVQTDAGPFTIDLHDTYGLERFGGLRDGYFINSKAAIIMFDVTKRVSYKNTVYWYKDFDRIILQDKGTVKYCNFMKQ